jgi:hypothetical protein
MNPQVCKIEDKLSLQGIHKVSLFSERELFINRGFIHRDEKKGTPIFPARDRLQNKTFFPNGDI